MLTKNRIKLIKSLAQKKFRQEEGMFIVEGGKNMQEALHSSLQIHSVYCDELFFAENKNMIFEKKIEFEILKSAEIEGLGTYIQNKTGLLLAYIPENKVLPPLQNQYALLLDKIQDPGNLGTIIRIADWYGIRQLVCSEDTVELYNPKVIASTMGSFARVAVYYTSLKEYLSLYGQEFSVYGAYLQGENIHRFPFDQKGGLLVMGNESKGISEELKPFIRHAISIPRFGGAESLNVAMATAIICDNIKRQIT